MKRLDSNLRRRTIKRVYLISCVVLSILLISPVTIWADSCPEGQKWNDRTGDCVKDSTSSSKKKSTTRKGKQHPFGGTCEAVSRHNVIRFAQKVVSGMGGIKLPRGMSLCKHNVELIENNNEKLLDITTGLGDAIQSAYWTDIGTIPARRRFELQFQDVININQGFRLEYSVRLPDHNSWMKGIPDGGYQYFWITQLGQGKRGAFPPLRVMVRRFKGIFINVGSPPTKIQDVSDFGKWVKIKLEYKPTRGNKGFKRLWVDDQLVVDENNIQTIWNTPGPGGDFFMLKFGIYQGVEKMSSLPNFDPRTVVENSTEQQSIQFKNFRFKKI